MLWIRCTGRDSRLVSMPITYCSYTFISAMRCSSAKLATASPSSSSPASCLDSSPAPREVAASKTAPPPASRTSEMKPRLSQIERFLRTTSVAMPSSDAKSASAHLCCAPNRSRIVACSGLHCTSPTLPSGKVTYARARLCRDEADSSHALPSGKDDVEGDGSEGRLPHELARRLDVCELLLEARHLLLHAGGQRESVRGQARPAQARDDGRVDQRGALTAARDASEVLLDRARNAARLGHVGEHDLARRERGVPEPLLEELEIAHLLLCVVRRRREQLLGEHLAELVDERRLGAVDLHEDREDVWRAPRRRAARGGSVGGDRLRLPLEHGGLVAAALVRIGRHVAVGRRLLHNLCRRAASDRLE
mmetsp:Transcript_9701/g.32149  ORF Transcript_9701/g.32149 Transcript_9701/m.32149 type:complete len:365 (-) Transcript_9701:770-1864(-)